MRRLLIIIPALVVLLILIDRAALFVAEREIGTRVQSAYSLSSRPGVSIRGFPFLTQVASGHYGEVDVSISRASADGVQVRDIHARFTGVRASLSLLLGQNSGSVTAGHATGSALIPYSQVQSRMPKGTRLSPDGSSLRVTGAGPLGKISGTVRLGVRGTGISVTPQHLAVGGITTGTLTRQFTFVIGVGNLPLRLSVSGARVSADGLVLSVTGHNVEFARA